MAMTKSNQPRRFRNFLPPRYNPDDAIMQRYTGCLEREVEYYCDQVDAAIEMERLVVLTEYRKEQHAEV